MKRVVSEIKELTSGKKYKKVVFTYDESGEMTMKIEKKNNNLVNIVIPEHYPFKMPSVYVNGVLYRSSLIIFSKKIQYYFDNPSEFYIKNELYDKIRVHNCLCCLTLTCANNWTVGTTITKILAEMEETNKCKKMIQMKLLLNEITHKHYVPQDLIFLIYQYL